MQVQRLAENEGNTILGVELAVFRVHSVDRAQPKVWLFPEFEQARLCMQPWNLLAVDEAASVAAVTDQAPPQVRRQHAHELRFVRSARYLR